MSDRRDPYRILQVHRDAELDVIRAAYRVLAHKVHPDRSTGPPDPAAERKMADLNWAYGVLRDPDARRRWDLERRLAAPATPQQPRTHGRERAPVEYDASEARLDFGRYQGWTLREVARRDPVYLAWLRRHASGARYRPAIDALQREAKRAK